MKQFSFRLEKLSHLELCITAFLEQCPKQYSCILASVFTSSSDPADLHNIVRLLEEKLPHSTIVGTTTFGEIAAGHALLQTTVITFMVFENTTIRLYTFDNQIQHPEDAGKILLTECQKQPALAGIEILATSKTLNLKPFLDILSQTRESIPVFGGCANSYESTAPTYVFSSKGILKKGIIAVCFCSTALHIQVTSNLGWKPLGRTMMITATYGSNIVRELDHKPAISVYEKYLNITKNERFYTDTMEFPIFIERNGHNLARLPLAYLDDGALVFTADCQKGENARLAYGDPNEILRNSKANQRETEAFAPEGILLVSCSSRRIFLKDNIDIELEPYRNIAPVAGFFSCGEIARRQTEIEVSNIIMVTVSFREGVRAAKKDIVSFSQSPSPILNDTMSLVQRMARFIAATSTDLEEANLKLEKLAHQDRLTELYNRGEIEHILQNEMSYSIENQMPLSVIMLDVDDFKAVNDTYGHDTGDKVLKTTAQVLMKNIRRSDFAGRWGGEEFLVVLPHAPLDAAISTAERIRMKLSQTKLLPDDKNITASFGAAELKAGEQYQEFYRRLDSMLYAAKQTGKNRVISQLPSQPSAV